MSSAFNPNTVEYRQSVNTPDFPAPWIINQPEADALAATNVPRGYWKSVGGIATEMTAPEKAAVDAANLQSGRDAASARMDNVEDIIRALALTTLDQLNAGSAKTNAILDAIDAATSLADLKAGIGAIANLPIGTSAQMRDAIRAKLGT